jgi:hypothetical protein
MVVWSAVMTLLLTSAAHARSSAALSLNVVFAANGTIAVTLPDGSPVGTTAGSPSVIPAGYYTLNLSGPGGCTQLPLFELKGPGEDLLSDMTAGEVDYTTQEAYLRPSSTYTWRNYAVPNVIHTFVTSATVEGAAPSPTPPGAAGSDLTVSSSDLVGSGVAPMRGTLAGAVSAAGRITLAYKGRSVARLKAGRYRVTVRDRSATSGFVLQRRKKLYAVTGARFVGRHAVTIRFTPGRWTVAPRRGSTTYAIVVG